MTYDIYVLLYISSWNTTSLGSVSDGPFLCFPALILPEVRRHPQRACHPLERRKRTRESWGFSTLEVFHKSLEVMKMTKKKTNLISEWKDFGIKFEGDGVIRLVDIQSS